MTHPKGAGFGFDRPGAEPRTERRLARGRREGAGLADFTLPGRGAPVHLSHHSDCPQCLEAGRLLDDCGQIEVTMGLHLSRVVFPGDVEGPALGLTLTPRFTDVDGRVTADLECSAGCVLTQEQWDVALGASFLDLCEKYADRVAQVDGKRRRRKR